MPPPPNPAGERVTTNISPLTSLTLLLMTPLPEASPSATRHPPRPLARHQIFHRRGCSHDSTEIRSFPPISRSFLFFSSSSSRALLYSPRRRNRRNRTLAFSLVSISLCPRPSQLSFLSLILSVVLVAARSPLLPLSPSSVHPFLRPGTSRGSGSQVTLKNLADGRKIGDTYIIHCARPPSLSLPREAVLRRKPVYLTNCMLFYIGKFFSYNIS